MKLAKHIWILRIVNWMYFVALNKNKMVLSFPWIMIWGHEWKYFCYTIRELHHDWQKNHGIHHLISHTSLLALQINDTMKTNSDPPHHHCYLRCIIRLWHFDVCKPIWWRHLKRVSSRNFVGLKWRQAFHRRCQVYFYHSLIIWSYSRHVIIARRANEYRHRVDVRVVKDLGKCYHKILISYQSYVKLKQMKLAKRKCVSIECRASIMSPLDHIQGWSTYVTTHYLK